MKVAGITGVLNVQTDQDHKNRMVDWSKMEELYKEAGIDVVRVPIEVFFPSDDFHALRSGLGSENKAIHAHVSLQMASVTVGASACAHRGSFRERP